MTNDRKTAWDGYDISEVVALFRVAGDRYEMAMARFNAHPDMDDVDVREHVCKAIWAVSAALDFVGNDLIWKDFFPEAVYQEVRRWNDEHSEFCHSAYYPPTDLCPWTEGRL